MSSQSSAVVGRQSAEVSLREWPLPDDLRRAYELDRQHTYPSVMLLGLLREPPEERDNHSVASFDYEDVAGEDQRAAWRLDGLVWWLSRPSRKPSLSKWGTICLAVTAVTANVEQGASGLTPTQLIARAAVAIGGPAIFYTVASRLESRSRRQEQARSTGALV